MKYLFQSINGRDQEICLRVSVYDFGTSSGRIVVDWSPGQEKMRAGKSAP